MGVYESHTIVMTDGKKIDISYEMFELVAAALSQKPRPEDLTIGKNIIFTRHILAIREKNTWRD